MASLGQFLEFMTQKDAFLRHFPRFYVFPTNKYAAGWSEDPHAKIVEVYNPKKSILKAFFPFFQVIILPFPFPF